MHVHGHHANFNPVDLSSTRAAEKEVSAQRAADVRGQLQRSGLDIEGEANPFESFMVGNEQEGSSRQQQSRNQQRSASSAARTQSAENEPVDEPISFWV
ncbi:MAG: hypothetical protein ABI177_10050 [Edaphobacter sp.]